MSTRKLALPAAALALALAAPALAETPGLGRTCHLPSRHGDAVASEERLGLVLVNLHGVRSSMIAAGVDPAAVVLPLAQRVASGDLTPFFHRQAMWQVET